MFRLATVDPAQATGDFAALYAMFPPQLGIPAPLRLLSASPFLFSQQARVIQHFRDHPNLDTRLMALIRYLVAAEHGFPLCEAFNGNLLQMFGLNDKLLADCQEDPDLAPLAEREKTMLKFVLKAVRSPEQVVDADIAGLRELGFGDSDILEALWVGSNMVATATMVKAMGWA